MQFSAIPFNLLGGEKKTANYLTTGAWSESAIKEAKKFCTPHEVWADSGSKFTQVPSPIGYIYLHTFSWVCGLQITKCNPIGRIETPTL